MKNYIVQVTENTKTFGTSISYLASVNRHDVTMTSNKDFAKKYTQAAAAKISRDLKRSGMRAKPVNA